MLAYYKRSMVMDIINRKIITCETPIYTQKPIINQCPICGSKITTKYEYFEFKETYEDETAFKAKVRICPFCLTFFMRSKDYYVYISKILNSRFDITDLYTYKLQEFLPICPYLAKYTLFCECNPSKFFKAKCPCLLEYYNCCYYTDKVKYQSEVQQTSRNCKSSECKYKQKDTLCSNIQIERYGCRCPYEIGQNCKGFRTIRGERAIPKGLISEYYDPEHEPIPDNFIDWTNQLESVFIYSSFNYCLHNKHSTSNHNARIVDLISGKTRYLKVLYCEDCQKYYAAKNQIDRFIRAGIALKVKFISLDYSDYSDFKSVSDLALYGYNVRKNGLKDHDRMKLLVKIIENGLMSPHEIIDHLNGLISLHQYDPKWSAAIDKYRDDIAFVNDYKFQNPDVILKLDE